jgi:hypothetical protein
MEEEKEVFDHGIADLDPFDRKVPAGSLVRIAFRLKGGFRTPILVVVYPDGRPDYVRSPDSAAGNRYEMSFRADARGGVHRVSLVAFSPGGDRTAAQLFVHAVNKDGKEVDRDIDEAPADYYVPLDPEEHPLRIERILYHRMNHFRRRNRLPPVPWHEGVARCAREQIGDLAKHWEETLDARTGEGEMLHAIPGTGPGGTDGPFIADRVRITLGWPRVTPKFPPAPPLGRRDAVNYVTEAITTPVWSLDAKFEQFFLRKSDYRAPMLSPFLTHAAGAACWRWYGWKARGGGSVPAPTAPGPAPPGRNREVAAALVFVQCNDEDADEPFQREARAALGGPGRAAKPEEKADAWRLVGQYALPEGKRMLGEAAKARDPVVLAGVLDGLWLSDPDQARLRTDSIRVRTYLALGEDEERKAAEPLRAMGLVRFDVATRREAAKLMAEVRLLGRAALDAAAKAAASGDREGARALFEAARKRFEGFPEGQEAAEALRSLGPPAAPPPGDGK